LSRGIGVHHGGLLPLVKEVGYLCPSLGYIRDSMLLRWSRFSLLAGWLKFFSQQKPLQWLVVI
jgi:hypothetical protein